VSPCSLDANVIVAFAVMAILLAVILARVFFYGASWMTAKFHVFHKKKWVLVYRCSGTQCPGRLHVHYGLEVQVGQWVCAREGCLAMGKKCLGETKDRILTIRNGELVPDEKAWSNPPENH